MSATERMLLAIEASNPSSSTADEGSVAVWQDDRPLAFEPLRPGTRHDDALMRAVDAACGAASITPGEIRCVAVSAGPGGYTGLRIALATAKMLGESLGAELVAVPTARVAAFGVAEDHPELAGPFVVALASKRGAAWLQAFRGVESLDAGAVGDHDALTRLLEREGASAVVADTHLPEVMRAAAERIGAKVVALRLDANLCARASIGLPRVSVDALAPIYPREPEAVRVWREDR